MSLHNDKFEQSKDGSHSSGQSVAPPAAIPGIESAGRRKLTKLGIGVPVVLTVASRSVLAGQCLSNILSGNLSDPNRDSNCSKGWSPGGWGQPGGNIGSYSTTGAWTAIGLTYGTLTESSGKHGNGHSKDNQSATYTGGSTISQVPAELNKESIHATMPIRDILLDNAAYPLTRHLVAAYFNARLSEVSGGSYHYILTVQQVLDLANRPSHLLLPGNLTLSEFLDTTW